MKKIPNWYVITGGPDSGKTTTINYLAKMSFYIIPEYARLLIKKELSKDKKLEEIKNDPKKFQDKLTKGQIAHEKKAPKNKIVFLDRGLPDSAIAYYRYLKLKVPKKLFTLCKNRYRKVFLLDILHYKKDSVRGESKKQAYEIRAQVNKAYKELGYEVVKVPVLPIEDRVKFILKHVVSS